jgi:bifunctional DNA-binding transcriptional regulator/antitoxin component of YhaV-PrlF toxin-antitoxin module
MAGSINYFTKVSRAGKKAGIHALKTYIPAAIVKSLGLEHGDMLWWIVRGRRVSIKAVKAKQAAETEIDTNLRQRGR